MPIGSIAARAINSDFFLCDLFSSSLFLSLTGGCHKTYVRYHKRNNSTQQSDHPIQQFSNNNRTLMTPIMSDKNNTLQYTIPILFFNLFLILLFQIFLLYLIIDDGCNYEKIFYGINLKAIN